LLITELPCYSSLSRSVKRPAKQRPDREHMTTIALVRSWSAAAQAMVAECFAMFLIEVQLNHAMHL